MMTKIFGHRGAAGTHPENTMTSFKEVERVGAHGVELDVQRSKDGILVVMHDEKVNRTTNGKGWIKDLTLKQIKRLDASYKFKKKYGVCQVPTLEEVFIWAKTNQLLLNVEIKNNLIDYEGIEQEIINLIHEYRLSERIIISSFNHDSLVRCHQIDPTIETAILFMERIFRPWEYCKLIGTTSIHPYHPVVTEELVNQSQALGIPVRPFTINDEKLMEKMIAFKCESIITDYPEKGLKKLKQK